MSEPCLNDATCTEAGTNAYECTCTSGFAGYNCDEAINPCFDAENDCSRFATCESTGPGVHSCTCVDGYVEQEGTSVVDRIGRGDPHVCVDYNEC